MKGKVVDYGMMDILGSISNSFTVESIRQQKLIKSAWILNIGVTSHMFFDLTLFNEPPNSF